MNCCRKQSSSPLGFRKELWAPGLTGWAGARMGREGNERSLHSLVMDCFPCFRTQPLGDVLPGMFDDLFSWNSFFFFFFWVSLFFLQSASSFNHLLFSLGSACSFPLKF